MTSFQRIAAVLSGAAFLLLTETGCVVSPQPQPVPGHLVVLDGAVICVAPSAAGVRVVGGAGAVNPGGATVWVLDLDSDEAELEAESAADGSFAIESAGALGHRFEVRARFETYEATPIEIDGPSCP